jgi:hypothetical protein
MRNIKRNFDPFVKAKLGIYVYLLIDPRDRRVFYVGKGGGSLDGSGNSRVFAHFDEADNPAVMSQKVLAIRAVWAAGRDVEWQIVRRGLGSPEEAFHVEAAIIDALRLSANGSPDNDQAGHGVTEHSHLSQVEVLALGAPVVNPDQHCYVFVFDVNKAVARRGGIETISQRALYYATRRAWTIGEHLRQLAPAYAVGTIGGISYAAFAIRSWKLENRTLTGNSSRERKSAFHRHLPEQQQADPVVDQLLRRDWQNVLQPVMGYRKRGRPVAVEFFGNGTFSYCLPRTVVGLHRC